jgi:hypothetical protein
MSHESQTKDLPITYIETDYDYDSDFGINYGYDTVNGFLYIEPIPDFFTQEFQGLYYDGVSYSWDEIEYRMGVDYPTIPEPADAGFASAVIVAFFVLCCFILNRFKW